MSATPNEQDVINVLSVEDNMLQIGIVGPDIPLLPITHGKVGINWGKICSHSGPFTLEVKLVQKVKR